MKKRICCVVLSVLLIFTVCIAAFAAADGTGYYKITASSLNMRSGAGSSYSKVTSIPKDVTVTVTQISGEWGYTTYAQKSGWINLNYAQKVSAPSDYSNVDVMAQLDKLREKFPDGMYWNHVGGTNNPDGCTSSPCTQCHGGKCSSTVNGCECNVFSGTIQCHGFALKLGYDIFGSIPRTWEVRYTLDDICVGDIIRYRNNQHTVMVTDIGSDYLVVVDCNWDYHCGIDWDRKMSLSKFTNINYIYHAPGNTCKGTNDGTPPVTSVSASADKNGYVTINYSISDGAGIGSYSVSVSSPEGSSDTCTYGYNCGFSVKTTAYYDLDGLDFEKGTYTVTITAQDISGNKSVKTCTFDFNSDVTEQEFAVAYNVTYDGFDKGNSPFITYDYYTVYLPFKKEGTSGTLNLSRGIYELKLSRAGYTSYYNAAFKAGVDTLPENIVLYGGDCNGDNIVNSKDISFMISCFGGDYYEQCDMNGDGCINAKDLSFLISNYGKSGITVN